MNTKKGFQIIAWIFLACGIMTFVELILCPTYLYKSLIKVITFVSCIVLSSKIGQFSVTSIFHFNSPKQLLKSICLGVLVYLGIIACFLFLKNYIDLSLISNNLSKKENISKENFLFVALYISFINSFLEEFLFRGLCFLQLRKFLPVPFCYAISSMLFSFYHVFILIHWFSLGIFLLVLFGLLLAGLFFDYLDRNSNIYNSWLVHMAANFAINSIGFYMFR